MKYFKTKNLEINVMHNIQVRLIQIKLKYIKKSNLSNSNVKIHCQIFIRKKQSKMNKKTKLNKKWKLIYH
jgi:hypothetical protein